MLLARPGRNVADAVRTAVVTRNYPIKIIWEKKSNKFVTVALKQQVGFRQ